MTKNPLINALTSSFYIIAISLVMDWGTKLAPKGGSVLAPMAVISLFTLSAAIMGYVFCYQPLILYFEDKKKQAVRLFLETTGVFALVTVSLLVILFSGLVR